MLKRMVLMLLAVAAFIAVVAFVKYRQIQTSIEQSASFQPPPEAVTTLVAQQAQWQNSVSGIGTVEAVHGVTVSADLPGIVERIDFDSGESVQEGALLVLLDTRQELAQLKAAEARRELARLSVERIRGLRQKGVTSQAELDAAAAEYDQAVANVGVFSAAIDRKSIRAPFAGILGIRQVHLGQYLMSGDPVVPLQSLDPIYVNFNVPQQELSKVRVGSEVRMTSEGIPGAELSGKVTAINSIVDPATRNIEVQATLRNADLVLRPGMFVEARVLLADSQPVVALPASAVLYAPYGDSVFIVEDVTAPDGKTYRGVRQQFVKLGSARGDQIAVLSGVEPGEEVVTSGVFKLRNGAAVLVNNEIQPGNDPAPTPEDS
ncbi:MAG: efflux RND transporter periplasmic adaptor subunit [Vicinamibacteria bacterium]